MLTSITPYNIQNNNKLQPSFSALYFKNSKIQRVVQNSPYFPKVLRNKSFQNAIENYNVVVTDIPKWFQRGWKFKFQGCTDVVQKGENIIPAGFKTPIFDNRKINDFWRLYVLNFKDNFDKLYFENNKMSEAFMNNWQGESLLQAVSSEIFKEKIGSNKVLITQIDPKNIYFCLCRKITQDKKGAFIPEGYRSVDINSTYLVNELPYYLRNIDDIQAAYDKVNFKNDKVRQQFLTHYEHDEFLSNSVIRDALAKYNIVVTNAKKNIEFVISSDIAQNGNTITPANFYSRVFNFSKTRDTSLREEGLEHLDNLITAMDSNKTAGKLSTAGNMEHFF